MTHDLLTCPVCERGHLNPITYSDQYNHNGRVVVVDGLEGYQCDQCSADPIYPEQARRNHLRIADAKRTADGLMTGAEIKALRAQYGFSQQDAAAIFGGGNLAFSKYECGHVIQSVPMDNLMRVSRQFPGVVAYLAVSAGLASVSGTREVLARFQNGDVKINSPQGLNRDVAVSLAPNVHLEFSDMAHASKWEGTMAPAPKSVAPQLPRLALGADSPTTLESISTPTGITFPVMAKAA